MYICTFHFHFFAKMRYIYYLYLLLTFTCRKYSAFYLIKILDKSEERKAYPFFVKFHLNFKVGIINLNLKHSSSLYTWMKRKLSWCEYLKLFLFLKLACMINFLWHSCNTKPVIVNLYFRNQKLMLYVKDIFSFSRNGRKIKNIRDHITLCKHT